MKPLIKTLALLLVFSEASAGVFMDRVHLFDWSPRQKQAFYNCSVQFWNFTAEADRRASDANYLYMVCDDREEVDFETWDIPLYQRQGVLYDEIGIGGSGPVVELHGCYVTKVSVGFGAPQPDSSIIIECPESAMYANGFEGYD